MAPPGCGLQDANLLEQLQRYRRLGATAASVEQLQAELRVWFHADVDLNLLRETVAIESQCCSFFVLDYDSSDRRLSITIGDPDQLDALAVLRSALGDPSAVCEPPRSR